MEIHNEKAGVINMLNGELEKIEEMIRNNTTLQSLEEQIALKRKNIVELELEKDSLTNQSLALEYSKDMLDRGC